jgi:hypothetical protein
MLAWEIARQWQSENCMTPFEEVLGWHLSGGLIYSTKDVFLLARECHWTGEEMISRRDAEAQGLPINAWFVELAASATQVSGFKSQVSPIREFLRVAPRAHEWTLWYRAARNRPHNIHAYKWAHLARRVNLSPSPLCASASLRENL